MNFKKVLFINLDRIGDVIRSTFLFRIFKERYPKCFLACLTLSPANEILSKDPHIDTVMTLPHKEIRDFMSSKKTILHMCLPVFDLLNSLKIQQFDLVINPFSEFGALAIRYIKPKYVLGRVLDRECKFVIHGKETAKFSYIMSNQEGLRSKFKYNFADIYSRILQDIGIKAEAKDLYPKIYIGPRDESFARDFLSKESIAEDDIKIGMQVGAFSKDKRWPIEKFRKLVRRLQDELNVKIIITGSCHEAKTIVADMIDPMKRKPAIAAGKTTVTEASAVINKCDLFISNDTGPMHIAAACGIPVIALFGKERSIPEESRPWGEGHTVIAKERIGNIRVEEVFDAVKDKIESFQIFSSS